MGQNTMTKFLDSRIVETAQNIISSNDLFYKEPSQKEHFNFICASLQRIHSAVIFLNKHSALPDTSADFIHWLVYASMLKEAVYYLFKNLHKEYRRAILGKEKDFFYRICMEQNLPKFDEDDKFFSLIRSLVFAHPTDVYHPTSSSSRLYSPLAYVDENKKEVGAMIYISGSTKIQFLQIPFVTLKEYINSRYQLLNNIIDYLNEIIEVKNTEWKKRKINTGGDVLSTLKDIVSVLQERCMEHYEIDELITYLTLQSSIEANNEPIAKYRQAIVCAIPELCITIENMNYDRMFEILGELVGWGVLPKCLYENANYDFEKIICLSVSDHPNNIWYGLRRAQSFSDNFAKKWVTIDTEHMSIDEIKLLTIVACYCEKNNKIDPARK